MDQPHPSTFCTCEIHETELVHAAGAVLGVVQEDGEGETPLIKAVSSNDSQLPQRNLLKVIHCDEDISSHLSDGLRGNKTIKKQRST